jgi:hypothetical protein
VFYIDVDLVSKLIYIFPVNQDKKSRYLISVKTRYEADQIMRKLNSKLYTPPPKGKNFESIGEVVFGEIQFQAYRLIA